MRAISRVIIGLLVLAAATGLASGGTPITVRIGAVRAPTLVPVLVAQEEGFFTWQDVRAEIVTYPGVPAVRQALINREVDAAVLSVGATLQAFDQGIKLRNLVLLLGKPNATIVTQKDLRIPKGDLNALRGKRIGVDAPGGRVDVLLRLMLLQKGIDPNRELTIIPTGEVPGHLAAMQARRVDAQVTWEPGTSLLTMPSQTGLGDVFLDMRAFDTLYPLSRIVEASVVAHDEWVRDQRDVALRVSRAVACTDLAIRTHPDLVARAYRQLFPGMAPEVYENIARNQPLVYWQRITRENVQIMSDLYRALGLVKGTVRFEDVVAEGFPLSWWPKCR